MTPNRKPLKPFTKPWRPPKAPYRPSTRFIRAKDSGKKVTDKPSPYFDKDKEKHSHDPQEA